MFATSILFDISINMDEVYFGLSNNIMPVLNNKWEFAQMAISQILE